MASNNTSMSKAQNAVDGMIDMIAESANRLVNGGRVQDMNEMAAKLAVVVRSFEEVDAGDDYGVELLKRFGL